MRCQKMIMCRKWLPRYVTRLELNRPLGTHYGAYIQCAYFKSRWVYGCALTRRDRRSTRNLTAEMGPACHVQCGLPGRSPISRKRPNVSSEPNWHLQEPPIVHWNAPAEIRTAGECLVKRHSTSIAVLINHASPHYATRIGGDNWPMFNEISPAKYAQK